MNGVCPVSTSHNFNSIQFSSIAYSIDLEARRIRKNEVDGETNNIYLYIDYFVQVPVSSNLSDNGKHKILTNQSCLSLNFCHFLFIDSTCNCFSFFLSTLPAIVFLKHMHKDQVAVFTLGISICNLVLQSIKVCM